MGCGSGQCDVGSPEQYAEGDYQNFAFTQAGVPLQPVAGVLPVAIDVAGQHLYDEGLRQDGGSHEGIDQYRG